MTAAWKKLRFILSVSSDFHIIDSLLIAVHAFVNLVSMFFSVDSTLLPRYVNVLYMYICIVVAYDYTTHILLVHMVKFVCKEMIVIK